MAPSGSLAQIASDVQLAIIAFLDPPDIISLSETCHTLHQTCSQKIVWANAFRQMCSQNKVFVPSYPPIQEMSTTELRQHTLSPHKLLGLLHEGNLFTGQSRLPDPVRRKIRCPNGTDNLNNDVRFRRMFLVPGGRYLVTKSGDNRSLKFRIDVWDLSFDRKGSPLLVATSACDPNSTWAISPSKLDDGEFLIAIVIDARFCVLSFNPSLPGPKISSIASISIGETPIYQYVFNDPFLIYFTDDYDVLTVCNFREDLWGSYHLDVNLGDPEAMLYGNVIIICARDEADRATFYGWDLSNLQPRLDYLNWKNSTEMTHGVTPLFVLTQEAPLYKNVPCHFLGIIGPLDQWYTSNDTLNPFVCDVILGPEGDSSDLVCCVQFPALGTGRRMEEITFKAPSRVGPIHSTIITNCHLSNGHLLRTIPANGGIQIQVTATPIGNSASKPQVRSCNLAGLTEERDDYLMWDSVVVDYVSGRLCVRLSGRHTIDILEFLHLPNANS